MPPRYTCWPDDTFRVDRERLVGRKGLILGRMSAGGMWKGVGGTDVFKPSP